MLFHLSSVHAGAPVELSPYSMDAPAVTGTLIFSSARDVVLTVPAEAIAGLRKRRLWSVRLDGGPPLVTMVGDLSCQGDWFEVRLQVRHDLCLRAA